jgi:hypothetical protein
MKKPKNQTTIKEDSGKLLQDIGKLIFGSMFLGGVLRGELPQNMLIDCRVYWSGNILCGWSHFSR